MTISKENFIKSLYHLMDPVPSLVSISAMAASLNISKPAVVDMARKMADDDIVSYIKYKGLRLTPKGNQKALIIIRKHRLWESFLVETLGYNWDEVHEEAELLEHSTSERLMDRIDAFLDFPTHDPHGDPIPDKTGCLPDSTHFIPLNQTLANTHYLIARITDDAQKFIQFVSKIGLRLNKEIMIVEKLPFDDSINIQIDQRQHVLSAAISSRIFVKPLNSAL